ncbi:hypothetical protein TWF718_000449 [Orbilia javanica]|uniref:Uncharacterized protein n=1 Tax=Orbilia javanica TaxID=47235 RepID=A0AAN8N815_9PEZI
METIEENSSRSDSSATTDDPSYKESDPGGKADEPTSKEVPTAPATKKDRGPPGSRKVRFKPNKKDVKDILESSFAAPDVPDDADHETPSESQQKHIKYLDALSKNLGSETSVGILNALTNKILEGIPESDQFAVASGFVQNLIDRNNTQAHMLDVLTLWTHRKLSKTEHQKIIQQAQRFTRLKRSKQAEKTILRNIRKCKRHWTAKMVDLIVPLTVSERWISNLAKFVNEDNDNDMPSIKMVSSLITRQMIRRLFDGKTKYKQNFWIPSDIEKAFVIWRQHTDKTSRPFPKEEWELKRQHARLLLLNYGLVLDPDLGVVVQRKILDDVDIDTDSCFNAFEAFYDSNLQEADEPQDSVEEGGGSKKSGKVRKKKSSRSSHSTSFSPHGGRLSETGDLPEATPTKEPKKKGKNGKRPTESDPVPFEEMLHKKARVDNDPRKGARLKLTDTVPLDEQDLQTAPADWVSAEVCACYTTVDNDQKWRIESWGNLNYKTRKTLMDLLAAESDRINKSPEDGTFSILEPDEWSVLCVNHFNKLIGAIGLRKSGVGRKKLGQNLKRVRQNLSSLGDFKSKHEELFTRTSHEHDLCFKLPAPVERMDISEKMWDPQMILSSCIPGIFPGEWERDGVQVAPDLFNWLFEDEWIRSLMEEEFDIMAFHEKKGGYRYKGLLGNSFYTLFQQVVNRDPILWMVYVSLNMLSGRDGYRYVVYPTPLRFAWGDHSVLEMRTEVDLELYARDKDTFQGPQIVVPFDNFPPVNSIIYAEGGQKQFHKLFKKIERLGPGGESIHRSQNVTRVFWKTTDPDGSPIPPMLKGKADKEYGKLNRARLTAGDVIMTMAKVATGRLGDKNGAVEAGTMIREALPRYIKVQPNLVDLEDSRLGSVHDIGLFHGLCIPPPRDAFGVGWPTSVPATRFPLSARLPSVLPLCDALLGLRSWDDMAVIADVEVVMHLDAAQFTSWVREYREKTIADVKRFLRTQHEYEKRWYAGVGMNDAVENHGYISISRRPEFDTDFELQSYDPESEPGKEAGPEPSTIEDEEAEPAVPGAAEGGVIGEEGAGPGEVVPPVDDMDKENTGAASKVNEALGIRMTKRKRDHIFGWMDNIDPDADSLASEDDSTGDDSGEKTSPVWMTSEETGKAPQTENKDARSGQEGHTGSLKETHSNNKDRDYNLRKRQRVCYK